MQKATKSVIVVVALAALVGACTTDKPSRRPEAAPAASISVGGQDFPMHGRTLNVGDLEKLAPAGGYTALGTIYINPKPRPDGTFEWYAFLRGTVTAVISGDIVVPIAHDGTAYVLDAAAACEQAAASQMNFKQSWTAQSLVPGHASLARVQAYNDTCSRTMPG